VAQGDGPEFKPQYCKKREKKKFNVLLKTLRLLQGSIKKSLEHTGIGNYFLKNTPIAQE
jgi:hypothetical protein